jgi:hypothetical protein
MVEPLAQDPEVLVASTAVTVVPTPQVLELATGLVNAPSHDAILLRPPAFEDPPC